VLPFSLCRRRGARSFIRSQGYSTSYRPANRQILSRHSASHRHDYRASEGDKTSIRLRSTHAPICLWAPRSPPAVRFGGSGIRFGTLTYRRILRELIPNIATCDLQPTGSLQLRLGLRHTSDVDNIRAANTFYTFPHGRARVLPHFQMKRTGATTGLGTPESTPD